MIMFKKLLAILCVSFLALFVGKTIAQDVGPVSSARIAASIHVQHNHQNYAAMLTGQIAAALAARNDWADKWVLITTTEVTSGVYQTTALSPYKNNNDCEMKMREKLLGMRMNSTLGYLCIPPQPSYETFQP